MSLVTKTIDSRILGKEMNLAVYRYIAKSVFVEENYV